MTQGAPDPLSTLLAPDAGGIPPLTRIKAHFAGNNKGRKSLIDREELALLIACVEALAALRAASPGLRDSESEKK